jgi:hypothetical protein
VRWATPEGVRAAAYHLQKALVSEDELDEGPWEPAVAREDDEHDAVVCRLREQGGVDIDEGVDDDENGLDDGAPTVVTAARYTVKGLLSNR